MAPHWKREHYTQINLTVESADIFFGFSTDPTDPACASAILGDDTGIAVEVASGVVRLNRQFTVLDGSLTTMVLDFDANRSVREIGAGNSHAPTMGPTEDPGPPEGSGRPDNPGNPNDGDEEDESSRYVMTPVITIMSVK